MKVFYISLSAFYALLLTVYLWGKYNKVQFNYPASSLYSTYGLDVSHHQGEVNWPLVEKSQFKFVFLKATEGETFKDKRFEDNYLQAKKAGLKVGAYHFWSFCKDPKKQVNNILSSVPRLSGDILPALDMETIKKCEFKNSEQEKSIINMHINIAISELSFQFGKSPIIYTTMDFISQHPEILKNKTVYWIRSLLGPPFLSNQTWSIWQYHNAGRVDGIEGPVDLNVISESVGLKLISQP